MSFEKHFTQSIEFRTRFDAHFTIDEPAIELLEGTFRRTRERAMQEPFFSIRQGICALAQEYAADTSVDAYSYQCLADCHVFLRACIEQKIVHEKYMTLTVGDVSYRGSRLFGATRETMEQVVANGISTQDVPLFHVWLTLADMTVIDLTIMDQLARKGFLDGPADKVQKLNVWSPGNPGKFVYHPILVDDEFIKRLQKPLH